MSRPPLGNGYGDVNQVGEVTSADALLAGQAAEGLVDLTYEQQLRADVGGYGYPVHENGVLIVQYLSFIIDTFPVLQLVQQPRKDGLGDVNNDGVVTMDDYYAIYPLYGSVTTADQVRADLNGDGVVDTQDSQLELDYLWGRITSFPAEFKATLDLMYSFMAVAVVAGFSAIALRH